MSDIPVDPDIYMSLSEISHCALHNNHTVFSPFWFNTVTKGDKYMRQR